MLNKKILLIFLAAFFVRLIALNQSLWLDEAVTANVVRNYGFMQIVSKFSPTDFHPPLYYLFMKLWTNVFGYSEVVLRFPSIIFSLLTGYFVYKIASLFHDSIVAIWAAAFFLFNPLIVYYSQEARMYMMATFLLTAGMYYLLKNKKLILFNLFIILSFYTFYGSIFMIVSMYIYLLYKKQYEFFIVSLLIFIVSLLLISPLLSQQLINSKVALTNVINWSAVLGKANIKNLLLIPIKFSVGRISFYPKWLYWGVAGVWTGFVWFFVFCGGLKKQSIMIIMTITIITAFVFSFFTPLLQYFRFIYLIPIMAILLAKKNTTVYCYGVAIGFMIFSLIYLLNPTFHREDWKSLVKGLPKDKPVYMITSSSDPIKYYSDSLKVKELTSLQELEKEIIVIPDTVDIYGFDYKSKLLNYNYSLKNIKNYQELTVETWIKK